MITVWEIMPLGWMLKNKYQGCIPSSLDQGDTLDVQIINLKVMYIHLYIFFIELYNAVFPVLRMLKPTHVWIQLAAAVWRTSHQAHGHTEFRVTAFSSHDVIQADRLTEQGFHWGPQNEKVMQFGMAQLCSQWGGGRKQNGVRVSQNE